MVVIRWKDLFERLEEAIDACERAANIVAGIVIKNSLSRRRVSFTGALTPGELLGASVRRRRANFGASVRRRRANFGASARQGLTPTPKFVCGGRGGARRHRRRAGAARRARRCCNPSPT
jgi:hypothetical protein